MATVGRPQVTAWLEGQGTEVPRSNRLRLIWVGVLLVAFVTHSVDTALSPYRGTLFETLMGTPSPKADAIRQSWNVKDDQWVVQLASGDLPNVVIYETDMVTVQLSAKQYLTYQEWAKYTYPTFRNSSTPAHYPSLDELSETAATDYREGIYLYHPQRVLIADLLKSGHVAVYDKRSGEWIGFIQVEDVVVQCGLPFCGRGDWVFYLPDGTAFLRVNYMLD
jgi:hypothetical protein